MSSPKKTRIFRSSGGKSIPGGPEPPIGSQRFAQAVADALHRGFGGTHAAVKIVVGLTGANGRSVKNWFAAKNGPSGQHLVDLARHSDDVLEAFLTMSGRADLVASKKMGDARRKLREMLTLLDQLEERRDDRK